jgi:hypothetical protein
VTLLFFLPLTAIAQDVPSGLSWGTISYYGGGGTLSFNSIPNGTLAKQLQTLGGYIPAVDSQGDVYLYQGTTISSTISMIYNEGAKVPPLLAAVTTNPVPGGVYLVAGSLNCTNVVNPPYNCINDTALQATFGYISAMSFDSNDNLYLADSAGAIRRIANDPNDPSGSTAVTTVVGQLNDPGFENPPADNYPERYSTVHYIGDVKVDSTGNIYLTDYLDGVIQVVYAGSSVPNILTAQHRSLTKGNIYIVAGVSEQNCSTPGTCGNGGTAKSASLGYPFGVEVDDDGNIYIADEGTETITIVYAGVSVPPILATTLQGQAPESAHIYTVAGQEFVTCGSSGTPVNCGDGGPALQASLNFPWYMKVDETGNLYLFDLNNHTIRKIDEAGFISASAGTENPGSAPSTPTGNGGPATSANFGTLSGFAIDSQNNLYVGDSQYVWQAVPVLPQTINFPSFTPKTYGAEPIALAATAVGPNNQPTNLPITYSIVSGPGKINTTSYGVYLLVTGAGTVVVQASQAGNIDYASATQTQSLTVNPAVLTVSATTLSKVFNTPNPALTYTIAGYVNGENATTANVTGAPVLTTTATASSPTGTYPITITIGNLSAPNYTFSPVNGELYVTGSSPQYVTFGALTPVTYGQVTTVNLSAVASSGLPVTFVVNSGPGFVSGTNGSLLTITGGGTISITAAQYGNSQYAAAPSAVRNQTVNRALLTVTGPMVTLTYGTKVDVSTFPLPVITGFIGGDSVASVTGNATYITSANGTIPHAGKTFPIQVYPGTLGLLPSIASNYMFDTSNFVPGTLTIAQATQTISFDTLTALIYGQSQTVHAISKSSQTGQGLPVTVTASGPGLFMYPPGSNTFVLDPTVNNGTVQLTGTGVGTLTITASQAGTTDYAAAIPVTQTINVGQAPLMIGVAQVYAREQGAPNPVFQFSVSGFVNGDTDIPAVISGVPNLTTDATQDSPPGTYTIVPSQGTLIAPNYYFVYVNGELDVTPPGNYTIAATPSSLTIPTGLSGQATLTITPLNFYQGTVTLSCGQVPANVTCVISPSTYVFPGNQSPAGVAPLENPAQGTVTILASSATVVGSLSSGNSISAAAFLLPGALSGLLIAFNRKRLTRHNGVWRVVVLLTLGMGMLVVSSCGGSSKMGTAAPGTTTVTITGSGTSVSGDTPVTATIPLSVTIQ